MIYGPDSKTGIHSLPGYFLSFSFYVGFLNHGKFSQLS